ncbi:Post-GPI attachment to proteins factor 2 [Chamberlinius hualienensis]
MNSYVFEIVMPGNSYHPIDNNLVISLNFCKFAVLTVSLPFSAFIWCVLLCLMWNFEASTATHCHVTNYLPSISAAIGGFEPQRYIWRILIALHATPRILIGVLYWMYYNVKLGRDKNYKTIINLTALTYIIEVSSLIGLSYIASIENKGMHEKCFIGFTTCSVLHMLLTVGLHKDINSTDPTELKSRKLKFYLTVANISSIVAALYFYYRHNKYCEPLVYTCFAFCEYIFVLTNMAFHLTAYYDFNNYSLVIGHEIVQKLR